MMDLLVLKERIRNFYGKYRWLVIPALKLVVSFVVFMVINNNIGYYAMLKNVVILAGLSVLCAFLPDVVIAVFAGLLSAGHAFAVSPLLSLAIVAIYLILFCFYLRLVPKQAKVILAVPILTALNIPYVLPILLALFAGPITLLSLIIGVLVTFLFTGVQGVAQMMTTDSSAQTLNVFNYVMNHMLKNKEMLLTIAIFAVTFFVVYLLRKSKNNHASTIAICAGLLICCFGFIVKLLVMEQMKDVVGVIVGIVLSGAIAFVAQLFRMTLDYTGTKNVQFEDDEYYYYVKAVPKMIVSTPEKKVTRINAQKTVVNTMDLKETLQDMFPGEEDDVNSMKGE